MPELISVHGFKQWNHKRAEYDFPTFKKTSDAITAGRGVIIPNTEEKVTRDKIDGLGRYDSARWKRLTGGEVHRRLY
jgi:hypothetical protein